MKIIPHYFCSPERFRYGSLRRFLLCSVYAVMRHNSKGENCKGSNEHYAIVFLLAKIIPIGYNSIVKGRDHIKPRIYLDNCCYNRPYDDQNQIRIEIETKAKLFVQKLIVNGEIELVVSYVSYLENSDNPLAIRKSAIRKFFKYASVSIEESPELLSIATLLKKNGLKAKDALHVASAISAKCDYFLSTDDKLLKCTDDRIRMMNPIDFILLWEARA